MSRKHFVAIAAEFKSKIEAIQGASGNALSPDRAELALNVMKDVVQGFCRVALSDNPRFDVGRFQEACGL